MNHVQLGYLLRAETLMSKQLKVNFGFKLLLPLAEELALNTRFKK